KDWGPRPARRPPARRRPLRRERADLASILATGPLFGEARSRTDRPGSREDEVDLERVEDGPDRVGEGQALAIGAALVAAREQQRHGTVAAIDDERAAVAPLAERSGVPALDLNLVVELQGAEVVLDHHVIHLERGHAALGPAGGPADLAHLLVVRQDRV